MSLRETIRSELATLSERAVPFDVHAHTGTDVDGTARRSEEHLSDLGSIGGRSVIFPLCVRSGYEAENLRVLEECRRAPDRLVPFARLDPKTDAVSRQASKALALGARGFKLHPRSEDFRLDHPGVWAIAAVAAEARVPVLIHAGLGVGAFGRSITSLAEQHPDCPLILAHAGISDLCWLWEEVASHPNLFFDTSWWNASDLVALFSLVPPGRILFGSDAPYMDLEAVLAIALRCARFAGLSAAQIELVVGGQLEHLLDDGVAVDAGSAPGPPEQAPSPLASRVSTALIATGAAKLSAGDPAQMVEMARLAVGDGSNLGEQGPVVAELLAEGTAVTQEAPWALAMAITLLATPGVESAHALA
ncbi:MAG TPA: amidohydrolase family protein [Solirubrobacterales bacterium]|nr:amidohydrolase family protein [Solirubrobacterales bacterium]